MDFFVQRERNELEVDLPELAVDFRGLITEVKNLEDISSPTAKRAKTTRNIPVEGATDIALNLSDDQRQPKLSSYKQTMLGGQMRSFQKGWYAGRPWLEYSQKLDAMFCYPCLLFEGDGSESKWTILGFDNWKIAMEKKKGIKLHEESLTHLSSMFKWTEYQNSLLTGSIEAKVEMHSAQTLSDNRHFIKTVGQVITQLPRPSLRGHREGRLVDDSGEVIDPGFNCGFRNRGNFLEILTAFGAHDKVIKEKLNRPWNAQ